MATIGYTHAKLLSKWGHQKYVKTHKKRKFLDHKRPFHGKTQFEKVKLGWKESLKEKLYKKSKLGNSLRFFSHRYQISYISDIWYFYHLDHYESFFTFFIWPIVTPIRMSSKKVSYFVDCMVTGSLDSVMKFK